MIIVTAGGLSEKIDSVRSIKNKSTGELAKLIAKKLVKETRDVYFLHTEDVIYPDGVKSVKIANILDLETKLINLLEEKPIKVVIHAMAVSDYHVEGIYEDGEIIPIKAKLDSSEDRILLSLRKNPKIISMIKKKWPNIKLIGFKLTDGKTKEERIKIAKDQINRNDCDYVLVNDIKEIDILNHKAILTKKNDDKIIDLYSKEEISRAIVEAIK